MGQNLQELETSIATISFAFNNSELIYLLKERGQKIMTQDFEKMREIEGKINKLKDEHFEDLTRPVCAFITFETDTGYYLACELEPKKNWLLQRDGSRFQVMGHDLYLKPATEPTNIIWEHRHFTKSQRTFRAFVATTIIGILLVISFAIIFYFKFNSIKFNEKYPVAKCSDM